MMNNIPVVVLKDELNKIIKCIGIYFIWKKFRKCYYINIIQTC